MTTTVYYGTRAAMIRRFGRCCATENGKWVVFGAGHFELSVVEWDTKAEAFADATAETNNLKAEGVVVTEPVRVL